MTARGLVRLRDIGSMMSRQQSHGGPPFSSSMPPVASASSVSTHCCTLVSPTACTALHESSQPSLELPSSFLALALTPGSLVPRLAYH
ncbi:hypothetical protein B0H14DRAFT_3124519 [Mycena olivaceomarginata]|nr:hypothetical protein B0H14DRAFT_3124519 [Mycena olivaceomarginata]